MNGPVRRSPLPARLWPGGRAAHDKVGRQEFEARWLFFAELGEEVPAGEQALIYVRLVDGG